MTNNERKPKKDAKPLRALPREESTLPRIKDWDTYSSKIAVATSWKSRAPNYPVGAVVSIKTTY